MAPICQRGLMLYNQKLTYLQVQDLGILFIG